MAPGGVEPPHADSKFLEDAFSQACSALSGALRFSQFCEISAVRDTVRDTFLRLSGQRSLVERLQGWTECPAGTEQAVVIGTGRD